MPRLGNAGQNLDMFKQREKVAFPTNTRKSLSFGAENGSHTKIEFGKWKIDKNTHMCCAVLACGDLKEAGQPDVRQRRARRQANGGKKIQE